MYLQDLLMNAVSRREDLHPSNIMYNLVVPWVYRQTFTARSFAVYGPRLWNSIPDDIKGSPTIESFKSRVKTLLYNNFFYLIIYTNILIRNIIILTNLNALQYVKFEEQLFYLCVVKCHQNAVVIWQVLYQINKV